MMNHLKPIDPLTQVVFVHDYIQLVFQESTLSLYNPVSIQDGSGTISYRGAGFCDALVALIGQKITGIKYQEKLAATFTFEGGANVIVSLESNHSIGSEAFVLTNGEDVIIAEQNA